MKFKILAVFSLSAVLLIGACGGNKDNNTNATNNRTTATATPTPLVQTNEAAKTDTAMQSRIQDALKKKGFNDVTVDTSTTPMTLRGTVAKGKLAEVMQTAMAANDGKPVNNQVTEK
jgi:ABC-type glycerol-3-phosphate transport system substrate-binding protein